jgi:hypothetical protein
MYELLDILKRFGVPQIKDLKMITDAEHVHHSHTKLQKKFEELMIRLGAD